MRRKINITQEETLKPAFFNQDDNDVLEQRFTVITGLLENFALALPVFQLCTHVHYISSTP